MRRTFGYMVLSCLIVLMAVTNSWAENTCSPSKWGENDEIGSANLVTPDQVLMAAKLVTKGKTHPLGIVIEPGMPAFAPRYTQLQVVQPGQQFAWMAQGNLDGTPAITTTYCRCG